MAGGTRSYEMARRLVASGHEVHMVTSDQRGGRGWRETEEAGIKVHWARVRYGNEMSFVRRAVSFVSFAIRASVRAARLRGDVIFATSTPLTIAIPALFASAVCRAPFVFEVRDLWPDVPIAIGALRNPVLGWLARRLEIVTYRSAAHIVALAPGMREDIIAKGIAADKISVIPNGCDLDVFSGAQAASPRREFLWLMDRKAVVFAGTIGLVNGVEYLVRLAERVLAIDREVRFVVIGEGRERARVRELAARIGVLDRNFFMIDALPKREVARWIAAADIVVALFTGPRVVWKDAVQNKFFDALAAGKPVANNFDGWQSQIACEEGVGVILDPHDIDHAARTLVDRLGDERWLEEVPERARRLAEQRFSRDRLAKQLESVLSAVTVGSP